MADFRARLIWIRAPPQFRQDKTARARLALAALDREYYSKGQRIEPIHRCPLRSEGTVLQPDLAIIGGGPAGISLAWRWPIRHCT